MPTASGALQRLKQLVVPAESAPRSHQARTLGSETERGGYRCCSAVHVNVHFQSPFGGGRCVSRVPISEHIVGFCSALATTAVCAEGATVSPRRGAGGQNVHHARCAGSVRPVSGFRCARRARTWTRGDQLARLYLATQLEALGYRACVREWTVAAAVRCRGHQGADARTWSFQASHGARGSQMVAMTTSPSADMQNDKVECR